MIKISGIKKVYSSSDAPIKALDDVSVHFPETGMVFLLGKSGSGKSTLLHILGGLDGPTEGVLEIDGRSFSSFSAKEADVYRASEVGFVFQSANLIADLNVGANVAIPLELLGGKCEAKAVEDVLDEVGLSGLSGRNTKELSGGQRQRVAIARAIIKKPRIVIADEPTGALDSETGRGVFELLKRLSLERLVVVASHDRASAEEFGDRVIELKDGKIIKDVSTTDGGRLAIHSKATNLEPRLPLKTSSKIAFSALKRKSFKLVMSVVLAGLSFSMFGSLVSLASLNKRTARASGLADSHLSSLKTVKKIRDVQETNRFFSTYGEEFRDYDGEDEISRYSQFSEDEVNAFNLHGAEAAGVFTLPMVFDNSFEGYLCVEESLENYYGTRSDHFDGFSDCGSLFCQKHFELLYGHYPEKDDEIAITSYKAEAWLHSLDYFGNKPFSSFSDILGSTIELNSHPAFKLSKVTICGIYKIGDIPSKFDALKSFPGCNDDILRSAFIDYVDNSFLNVAFVSDSFYDTYIGRYDLDRKPVQAASLKNGLNYYSILVDEEGKPTQCGHAYPIQSVIPSSFVSEHRNEFDIFDTEGKPIETLSLGVGEILVSEDYRLFCGKEKYRALLDDINVLMPDINGTSLLDYSIEAKELFLSEEMDRNKEAIQSYLSERASFEAEEGSLTEEAFGYLKSKVDYWYDELFKRSSVAKALRQYGYDSVGHARNDYSDMLFRKYLSDSDYEALKGYSNRLSTSVFEPLSENEWRNPMACFAENYSRVIGAVRALEHYRLFMPQTEAERHLEYSSNRAEVLQMTAQFNDRFSGSYASLCNAFLADELSEEDRAALIKTVVLTCNSEEELGLYELEHFRKRSLSKTSSDIMEGDMETIDKVVGSISCYGDSLKGTIVASPETLEMLRMEIDSHSPLRMEETDYVYKGDGKYQFVLSCSYKSGGTIDLLNESHGVYGYETVDPISRGVNSEIESQKSTKIVFAVVSVVFATISALLLASFISDTVRSKEREIGIIRAMGARSRDIFKIFAIETSAISLLSAILANVLGAILVFLLNLTSEMWSLYGVRLYHYGFPIIMLVLAMVMAVSFLASAGPIRSICKKEVVEAVRSKE